MLRHIFLWKPAPGVDPAETIRILNQLPASIPWIRGWEIGKHHGPKIYENTWDYGMTADFDSLEDYQAYCEHPLHKEIVPQIVPMFASRAVVDIVISDGSRSRKEKST